MPDDHWVRLADVELDFILEAAPEPGPHINAKDLIDAYIKYVNTVLDYIENGLETW